MKLKLIIIAIFSVILIVSVICDEQTHENVRIFKYIAVITATILMIFTIYNVVVDYKDTQPQNYKNIDHSFYNAKQTICTKSKKG